MLTASDYVRCRKAVLALVLLDRYARTWIKMTTSGNPHYLVKNCATALEMMQMLDELGKESYDMETLDLEFDNMVLEDGDQPSVFFVRLEELNIKYDQFQEANGKQYKKDERELIIKISNSVGEKYGKLIEVWKTKRDTSKTQVELYDDLKKVLNEYYKTHFSKLTELKGNGGKKGSLIIYMGMDGKVTCSHCGKRHDSDKCWIKYPHLRPNNKLRASLVMAVRSKDHVGTAEEIITRKIAPTRRRMVVIVDLQSTECSLE